MEKSKKELPIVTIPDAVLRKKAADVPAASIAAPKIQLLIRGMKAALATAPDGVGLAAPQVGEALRLFIVSEEAKEVDRAERAGWKRRRDGSGDTVAEKPYEKREWKYYVFINPAVKNTSRKKLDGPEGCLSVPGKFGIVARHEKITVEARDEHGKKITRGTSGFFARVIQHELDHLDGVLFIDKAKDLMNVPMQEKTEAKN